MRKIVVVGAGFAGVWSAVAAARARGEAAIDAEDLSISLVAPGEDFVIRPRLYEPDPGAMRVPLDGILPVVGVEHVRAAIVDIDVEARHLTGETADGEAIGLPYDELVLATGSTLVSSRLTGGERFFNVDTLAAAVTLDDHLQSLPDQPPVAGRFTVAVVGSGFTGTEVATEMVARLRTIAEPHGAADEVRVVLLERAADVGPELGPGPRPVILDAFERLGIDLRLGATVTAVEEGGLRLSDGSLVPTLTPIWTAGMRANALTERVPGERDQLGRLFVDPFLRVQGADGVIAAGDAAAARVENDEFAMQSCQHASAMGKHAGHNACAELLGLPLAPFVPDPYVTCLDLGSAGAVFTNGFDRQVAGSGERAKALKRKINQGLTPPIHDAAGLLDRASHQTRGKIPQGIDAAKGAEVSA